MHPILVVLALPHTLRFVDDIQRSTEYVNHICLLYFWVLYSGYFICGSVPFLDLVAAYSVLCVSGNDDVYIVL